MTEHETNPHQKRRTIPLENLVAPLILIIGIAGSIAVLRRFTGLPFWAAALLGVVGFFLVALGGLWLLMIVVWPLPPSRSVETNNNKPMAGLQF